MKVCSKCKVEKPFEAFHRDKRAFDGYVSACIECYKLRQLELKKNPQMQLKKQIRSSVILENKLLKRENKKLCTKCKEIFLIDDLSAGAVCKDCNAKNTREYNEKNKKKGNESYFKEYRKKNKEKMNEYYKEYYKEYREKNKEKMNEYYKEYYKEYRKKNKEKVREYNKKLYEKNKEKRREYFKEYYLKKKLEKQTNN